MTRLLRPAWLVLTPVVFSFLTWLIDWPAGFRTGFETKEAVTAPGVVLLVVWYGAIVLLATLGFALGARARPVPRLAAGRDSRVYLILTVAALIGVGYTYLGAELSHPGVLLASIEDSQFNDVRNLVPYAAGVPTLRYASALSAGIGLFHITMRRSYRPVHFLNLILLALSAALASRLSVILAVFVFLVLVVTAQSRGVDVRRRLRPASFGLIVLGAFVLLAAFNYIRNANYYEVNYNTTNPIVMNVEEIVTYADSPMQVSIGVAPKGTDDFPRPVDLVRGVEQFLQPSFTQTKGDGTVSNSDWFRGIISLENNLTTNSALVELYGELGLYCVPVMAVVAFLAGTVIGHCANYRNSMVLVAAVVGYCFLELWRTFLFNTGVMIFCVLAVTASCLVSGSSEDDDDGATASTPVGAGAAG